MQTVFKYLRRNFRLFFAVMFFLAFILNIAAQNQSGGWDLKSCIEYAIKNNISLKNLRLNVSSGEQDLLMSKYAKHPSLSAGVSQSLTYNSDGSGYTSSSFGLNSAVVLYKGNYYNNDIKSNEFSLQAANLDVEAAENDITLQITQAYLNVLLASENIEYVKDLAATSESQVQQCKEKYNSGAVALKDLMQLQSAMANDKYSLVTAENAKRQNILTLKKLLQLPTDTVFEIATPDYVSTEISVSPLDDVRKSALQSRPEIKSGEVLINKQNVELLKAKAGYLPTVSLGGSIGTGFSGISSESPDPYFSQIANNYNPSLGLTISFPIFNRNSTRISVAKSKIALEQTKLESVNTKTILMQEIEQAFISVQNAKSQFVAAVEQFNYAKESYRISAEQLKIGANNNVEYLQQKNLYIQAQQMYLQSKYSMILYAKIYNFYKGIPVTD